MDKIKACQDLAMMSVNGKESSKRQTRQAFDWAYSFHEGLAMVAINGKTGFIDKSGDIKIELQYDNCEHYYFLNDYNGCFSDGLAAVKDDNGYGFIDRSGNYIFKSDKVNDNLLGKFSEGLALVLSDGFSCFIDKTGRTVIPRMKYGRVEDFSEGLACCTGTRYLSEGDEYIDKQGQVVLDKTKNLVFGLDEGFLWNHASFHYAGSFHEGLARVECREKKGYIDKTGFFRSPKFKFHSLGDFYEGLAYFVTGNYDKCGYIDKDFNIIIEPNFESADNFHDGLACVRKNNKYGYINKTGIQVIPCQFDKAAYFSEGLAAIEINRRYGFIDSSGTIVIQPRFDSVRGFSEGLASVSEGGRWGYIDKSGGYAF